MERRPRALARVAPRVRRAFVRAVLIFVVVTLGIAARERVALSQACCAGTGVITPGRLADHEVALAGLQPRGAWLFGSFDANRHYQASPAGASEYDLGQDLIGAVRVLKRGQVALLVPIVETYRSAGAAHGFGGGLGDVNVSGRYDFVTNGEYRWVPGIAALVGLSVPTGTPPESATAQLAADSTGTGAFQAQIGASAEESFGPWLVTLSGIVAKRTTRTESGVHSLLGTQFTALASGAYVFENGAALAAYASYAYEGDAEVNGRDVADSARATPTLGAAAVLPVSDHFRLQASLYGNPPLAGLGRNSPTLAGLSVTGIYAWF